MLGEDLSEILCRLDINMKETRAEEYCIIDLGYILSSVGKRFWVAALAGFVSAAILFLLSAFVVSPRYASSVMLYVDNHASSDTVATNSTSLSDISTAERLVKTYTVILYNRETLEKVIADTGVDETYESLIKKIETVSVGGMEFLQVTVTTGDAHEAARVANGLAAVLIERAQGILEGSSVTCIDAAVASSDKVSPNVFLWTLSGFLAGCSAALVVIGTMAGVTAARKEKTGRENGYDGFDTTDTELPL